MALCSLEIGHTINWTRCKNWVCQALGRPKIGLTTKLESAEAGPGENGSAQIGRASLEIGRAKIGDGIQNWTHQDRPEFVYPILHFPTPNPTPFSGLLDALKQTLNATLKKLDAIRFFGNVSNFSF